MRDRFGFNFQTTYTTLPAHSFSRVMPRKVTAPHLVIVNHALAKQLGLKVDHADASTLAQRFAGNDVPEGAEPIAQAYAGHQYGHFTMLGDGRAHLLGEHITPSGERVDIQLKGSGQTPYSRRGDGRAALGPMLREYIISEAMHALGIPSSRSLAVVVTAEPVYRDTLQQGAVLTRVAASHIRVGTFEYFAAKGDDEGLRQLADYTIHRHYPEAKDAANPYIALLQQVIQRQIALVVHWLRVGFIHGVMNTDNMTISGETIDYGPCAFMDGYDPATVFSAIDRDGRYAYANQPAIARWNLACFANALLPLLHTDAAKAIALAEETIDGFNTQFQDAWLTMMRSKIGLADAAIGDEALIGDLLRIMQEHHMDYTLTFRDLIQEISPESAQHQHAAMQQWRQRWQTRLQQNSHLPEAAQQRMRKHNPAIIPRNHRVEEALAACEQGNISVMHRLLAALQHPYESRAVYSDLLQPPSAAQRIYQTFCGT